MAGFVVVGGGDRTLTREERVREVLEDERSLLAQRSRRRRYTVRLVGEPTAPPRFIVEDRLGEDHEVCLRGEKADRPNCSCDNFAHDELGSCVHIERARRWFLRKPKQIPTDLVSFWFSARSWVMESPDQPRELRVDLPEGVELWPSERFGRDGFLLAPPQGSSEREWIEAAVREARTQAEATGLRFELDPLVEKRFLAPLALRPTLPDAERVAAVWGEVLSNFRLTLHPYQEVGARFLATRGRAFLADDMGLGKTIQSIAAALVLRQTEGAQRAVIVCPASLKHQWASEIEKACGEKAEIVEGSSRQRQEIYRRWNSGFLVLNYELLLRDLEDLNALQPQLVVLDEAQRIKNQGTKTAQAVKQLHSRWAFVLTGTPLENRLLELHSLVEYLHVRALGPRWRLRPFHIVEDAQGRVLAYEGLEILRRRLRSFFLRRDRKQVLDQLPERTDHTFWTQLGSAQRKPYRMQAIRLATLVARGRSLGGIEVQQLLRALTLMRMLCNAHAQGEWDRWESRVRQPTPFTDDENVEIGSPKLAEFEDVLGELLDEPEVKVVVFSQWERMLRLTQRYAQEAMERRGARSAIFYGGLKSATRAQRLEQFRLDPELRVLFSTDAGGLGLNLQDAASIVINLEVPWNPAVLEQRVGRVHRMGQKRSVRVLHFVTRDAIEEKVRQVLEEKQALFDGVLTEGVDHVIFDEAARASLVERVSRLVDG
jgi:SNF2 family DNA or RNA helicase